MTILIYRDSITHKDPSNPPFMLLRIFHVVIEKVPLPSLWDGGLCGEMMADPSLATAIFAISLPLQPPSVFAKCLMDKHTPPISREGGGCEQKWYHLQDGVVSYYYRVSAYGAKVRTGLRFLDLDGFKVFGSA